MLRGWAGLTITEVARAVERAEDATADPAATRPRGRGARSPNRKRAGGELPTPKGARAARRQADRRPQPTRGARRKPLAERRTRKRPAQDLAAPPQVPLQPFKDRRLVKAIAAPAELRDHPRMKRP
jgi:hypothetical protein